MRHLAIIVALFALLATGCSGADEPTGTDGGVDAPDASQQNEGVDPQAVFQACLDAIAGTDAEAAGEAGCEVARDAFQTCLDQSAALEGDARQTALDSCQQAADAAVQALGG
ncbi:hypothetical protein BH23ACT9_BH23ACT9_03590 [soil metagenome]